MGAPEASKAEGHQIVETEHLMRSLLNLKVRGGGCLTDAWLGADGWMAD